MSKKIPKQMNYVNNLTIIFTKINSCNISLKINKYAIASRDDEAIFGNNFNLRSNK